MKQVILNGLNHFLQPDALLIYAKVEVFVQKNPRLRHKTMESADAIKSLGQLVIESLSTITNTDL